MNNQIEEMAKFMHYKAHGKDKYCDNEKCEMCWCSCKNDAEALYNAGYRKTFTSDFASDTQKAYKEGYIKGIEETEAEIEILKIQNKNLGIAFDRLEAENERSTERLKQVLLSIDTVKEMNAMCNIDEQRKQAVKEFAEKLKNIIHERDYLQGYAEIGLIEEIDELLKEYEK